MSAAKVRRTPYGVQIIINGTLNFEEALYALEKSLEMYGVPIGQAALNLGWREVDLEGMQRIEEIFKKTGVRLLGVISTSLTTNRAASKLGYTVVIGRVGISEYRDPAKDKHSAELENGGEAKASKTDNEAEEAEDSSEKNGESLWTKSVEIELPADWRSHIAYSPKQKPAEAAPLPARAERLPNGEAKPLSARVKRLPDGEVKPSERSAPSSGKRRQPLPSGRTEVPELSDEDAAKLLQMYKGQALLLISGKGGVGTTCCTGGLGAALAARGKSVLLIDGKGKDGHLHRILDLRSVDTALLDPDAAKIPGLTGAKLFIDRRYNNFYCLAGCPLAELFGSPDDIWYRLLRVCKSNFDFTLIDMPPLKELKHVKTAAFADRLTVVVNADILSVSAAEKIISLFEENNQQKINILISRFDSGMAKRGNCLSTEAVREMLDAEIAAVIPNDENVIASVNMGKPFNIAGKSKAAEAYRRLADKIIAPGKKEEASVSWLQKIGLVLGGKK